MVSLKRRLKQPSIMLTVFCFLIGVLGVALVFVGIGGGFLKPTGYSLQCNSTSPARANCVATWDKYSPNSRMYTNQCLCEREYVTYVSGKPVVGEVGEVGAVSVESEIQLNVGDHLAWKTKRIYSRSDDCALKFPANEIETPCWWYPLGDEIDRVTAYDYGDKTEFKSSNGVFAIGMLLSFISIVTILYVGVVSYLPSIGCF